MVCVAGIEPTTSWSQTKRSTAELHADGGKSGIRTQGGFNTPTIFKTAALNHSANFPWRSPQDFNSDPSH